MRQRHALYLSATMTLALQKAAESHRISKSAILERALGHYLTPVANGGPSKLQTLQQESVLRTLNRLEREFAVGNELTATFVRYFLMITPPLPASEHDAAQITGQLRFEQVIETIASRLRTDRSLVARVMAAMTETNREGLGREVDNDDTSSHAAPKPTQADGGDG